MKKLVAAALSGHYQLVPGSRDYAERIEKLKFNDNYIYPGYVGSSTRGACCYVILYVSSDVRPPIGTLDEFLGLVAAWVAGDGRVMVRSDDFSEESLIVLG